MTHSILLLRLAVAGNVLFAVWLFHGFAAEDTYILYRYVENLHRHGELIYNLGDRVDALTSPLHALLLSTVFPLTGDSTLANRLLGVALLLGAAALSAGATAATRRCGCWRCR